MSDRVVDEQMEVAAANLLSEVRAVRAWVELEKSRIGGSSDGAAPPVERAETRETMTN